MDFRVEITDPSIDDLAEIVSYIAQDSPDAASALGNHLLDAALSLAQTPHKGSPYRHIGNVRKLTVRPFKIFLSRERSQAQRRDSPFLAFRATRAKALSWLRRWAFPAAAEPALTRVEWACRLRSRHSPAKP